MGNNALAGPQDLATLNTPLIPPAASVSQPGGPRIAGIFPVDSAASVIQPGEWVTIYGYNLANGVAVWKGDFPTSLGGTSVKINGKAAFLSFVSPGQINLQAPDDAASGVVSVVVTTSSGSANSMVTLSQFSPSFLLQDSSYIAGIILRSDGSGAFGDGGYDILGPTGNCFGHIYIIDIETGTETWAVRTDNTIYTVPLVVGDTAFIGSTDKYLYILDLEQRVVKKKVYAGSKIFSPPRLLAGRIYFGGCNGVVYELDPITAEVTGTHQLPDAITNAITYNDETANFCALTYVNQLFAFRRDEGQS
jgi:outer membrane protein assembly factor BamB